MKKVKFLMSSLAFAFCIVLISCGGDAEQTNAAGAAAANVEAEAIEAEAAELESAQSEIEAKADELDAVLEALEQ